MDTKLSKQTLQGLFICGLATLFYVYDYFIQVSPAVITKELMREFTFGATGLGLLSSCFFYTYAGMQIPAGILIDRWGARALLFIAVLISGFGVLIFAYTHSLTWACIARALIGFGSAFSFIGPLYLAANWFEHRYFALIAGVVQLGGCLGSIFGSAPLAAVFNLLGWRHTMMWIAVLTFIMAFLFWLFLRDRPTSQNPLSVQKSYSFKDLALVLKDTRVVWLSAIGLISWIPSATIGSLWGVPYFMEAFNMSNTQAAAFVSIFWLSVGFSSPLLGWWSDKIKKRKPALYFCFFSGLLGVVLYIVLPTLPAWICVLALILTGIFAAIQSLTFAIAKDFVDESMFGAASGLLNMSAIAGGAVAQILIGFILDFLWDHRLSGGVPVYSVADYQKSIGFIVVTAAFGLWITYKKLPETYRVTDHAGPKEIPIS